MNLHVLPHPPRGSRLLAEFADARSMIGALESLRRESYHDIETFAPYDIPEVDPLLGLRRPRVGYIAAAAGLTGLIASYTIQWWANVYAYPLNAGGRPAHAVPAFVLATFEGTIAGAAIAAFVALIMLLRYPRPWAPEDEVDGFERSTIDRFWLGMHTFASERDRDRAVLLLERHGAMRTVKVDEGDT
jgi:hypothetical protein